MESLEEVGAEKVHAQTKTTCVHDQGALIAVERAIQMEEDLKNSLKDLSEKQKEVKTLHTLLKAIHTATDEHGNLDLTQSPELFATLKELQETYELKIDITKEKYKAQERERLIENIKMTTDDLQVQNDLLLHKIQGDNNKRHEAFQEANGLLRLKRETVKTINQHIGAR